MENFIGIGLDVYLVKQEYPIYGILIKIEDSTVYLRAESGKILIVPRENILYYSADEQEAIQQEPVQKTPEPEVQKESALRIFINGEFFTLIPVPPTMDLSTANERVLKTVWGNPDVQSVLRGRIQKTIEYAPGEINIILVEDSTPSTPSNAPVSFSIGAGGSPLTSYLNPSDMVSRLNNLTKKGDKNE